MQKARGNLVTGFHVEAEMDSHWSAFVHLCIYAFVALSHWSAATGSSLYKCAGDLSPGHLTIQHTPTMSYQYLKPQEMDHFYQEENFM